MNPLRALALGVLAISFSLSSAFADVRLVQENGRHQLLRDGQPYLVKGVGGDQSMEKLASFGGNSIRLWGDEKLDRQLDAAQKLGLTVTAGIWLGQVRQGFNWNDPQSLARQRDHVRATVEKYKDHPALLVWALGNEMEDAQGKNTAVWTAINNLAAMVKQIDPHHPVMTVIAEIGGDKVKNIHALCQDIDIIGINSYGGALSLGERYKKLGGTKPFILTEYGPAGIWEVQKDALGAYHEMTSTEKADYYRRVYQSVVLAQPGVCLGSYAFLWGQKQEATATWFSMFLKDGTRLGQVDVVAELWRGQPLPNLCPQLKSLKLEGSPNVAPGAAVRATLVVNDPENDPMKVEWMLQRDPEHYGSGGDHEATPPTYPEAITHADLTGAELKMPSGGGLYRLFAIVRDDHGGAAVANVPLRVNGSASVPQANRTTLPLVVYAEDNDAATYIPSGWMGDTKAIRLNPACSDHPQSGSTCLRCEFSETKGWGGVLWQNPAGDWGDRNGGYDLTGARKLTFWARGDKGGETVSFQFGAIGRDKKFFDTAKGALEKVALTKEWKQYEISLAGKDLSRIKTGFGWTLASGGQPVVFYLDNIRWE